MGHWEHVKHTDGKGTWTVKEAVCECGKPAEERHSLGIYAGLYCDPCWRKSGYRKEGPEGFDPADAGESFEPID